MNESAQSPIPAAANGGSDSPELDSPKPNRRKSPKDFSEEPKCCHGFPLALPIPTGDGLCPFLGERRGSIYRLIQQKILIQFRTKGLKEGVATVYGPSACDAKYGCRCGHRWNLEWLRKQPPQEVES